MKNIYKQQMEKYKLNELQYSELTGIPIDILRKMLKNEKVSDNMGLNDFFRKNTVKIHEELENNVENTKAESIKIKMADNEILNWYYKEYNKEKLFEITNTNSSNEFERLYTITARGKKASHWFYSSVVGKANCVAEVSQDVVVEMARQLKDIIDGNGENYYGKTVIMVDTKNELLKWHYSFDYHKFMEENNLTRKDFAKLTKVAESTLCALFSKKNYTPSEKMVRKIKHFIESYAKKQSKEEIEILDYTSPIEEIEIIDSISSDTSFDSNAYVRELIKSTLTDKEKWLITLFGGNIN